MEHLRGHGHHRQEADKDQDLHEDAHPKSPANKAAGEDAIVRIADTGEMLPKDHPAAKAGRLEDKSSPHELVEIDLQYSHNVNERFELTPAAAAAYHSLVAAAQAAGFDNSLFTLTSAYRSDAKQASLGKADGKWRAHPGGSAHRTGNAMDLWLGEHNIPTKKGTAELRQTKAWKWLSENAGSFGFSPYEAEPWHWEYNPK